MEKTNSWYVIAKADRRFRYNSHGIFHKSKVYYDLNEAIEVRDKTQERTNTKLIILKRTCRKLEV